MNITQLTIDNRLLTMKTHKGFTLVELLLAMGIMTILLTILMRVFMEIIEMRLASEAEAAVSQDLRYIYVRLAYDLNRASVIELPANPGEGGTGLRLDIGGVDHEYSLVGDDLVMDDGSGATALNSAGTRVTAVNFTHLGGTEGAQSVRYTLTLESTTERVSGPVVRSLTTTVGTR